MVSNAWTCLAREAELGVALDNVGALVGLLVRALEVNRQDAEQDDDETLAADCKGNNGCQRV